MTDRPIPDGHHTLTPALVVHDATAAIDFYIRALGAEELYRLSTPEGRIGHAQLRIGDSIFMLADEWPDWGVVSPRTLGNDAVSTSLHVYVEDSDALFDRAVKAGVEVVQPMTDQFYGDRSGTIIDPFGHRWTLSTHVEDVAPEAMDRRFKEFMSQMAGG
jgi:PhnB protein